MSIESVFNGRCQVGSNNIYKSPTIYLDYDPFLGKYSGRLFKQNNK